MSDYKQQAYDIHEQVMDGVDWIDGNPASPDQMRAYIQAGLQAAHAAGVAAERARCVAVLEAKIASLTVEANGAGDTLAAATGYAIGTLQGLLRKVYGQ